MLATFGNAPALAAKAATTTVPIVFAVSEDPVRFGLVASMEGAERGKNDKHENLVQKLARFTARIAATEAQKQRSIDLYAAGGLAKEAYIAENLTLDRSNPENMCSAEPYRF